jgi:RNA polymerase sigma factor for flagellar operon FliA
MVTSESSPRELLLGNLALLRELVGFLARRYRLNGEQTEELESFVRLRLVEDDYLILRQWRQHSTLKTYLTVVVQRLFHDYCNQLWGKWRTSAAAVRLGPLAAALEELLYREGLTFQEACQVLGTRRDASVAELTRLRDQLPPRPGRPRAQSLAGDEVAGPASTPTPEEAAVQRSEEQAVTAAIAASLKRLRAQDRLLLRLHFGDGLSVAEVARGMAVPQKALYKRLTSVLKAVRRDLREAGLERHDVSRLLQRGPTLDFGLATGENEQPRPSKQADGDRDLQRQR